MGYLATYLQCMGQADRQALADPPTYAHGAYGVRRMQVVLSCAPYMPVRLTMLPSHIHGPDAGAVPVPSMGSCAIWLHLATRGGRTRG